MIHAQVRRMRLVQRNVDHPPAALCLGRLAHKEAVVNVDAPFPLCIALAGQRDGVGACVNLFDDTCSCNTAKQLLTKKVSVHYFRV